MPAAIPLAIIGSTVGGIASSAIGSSAAKSAANAQVEAANNAANLERQSATDALNFNKLQYGNSLSLLSPFYNTGTAANSRLAYLMGLNPAQGLPAGVTNPNAPPTANGSTLNQGGLDLSAIRGSGAFNPNVNRNPLANDPNMGNFPAGGGGAPQPLQDGTAGGGFNSFSAMAPRSGMAFDGNGLVNGGINPSATANATPGQVPFQNPDIGNFNAGTATASTGDAITANGSPGMVPRTDGGGVDPNAGPNSFGSLAQGWDKTFSSPTNLTEDPGYNFRLQEGLRALQNSAAARGGLLSGGTAKSINDYAGGSASQEYQNTYNRALQNYNTNYNTFTNDQSNLFNRLQALSGGGQTSANQLSASGLTAANNAANIGLTSAGQIGQQLNNAGAATGSGYVGSANAITGGINNAVNSLSLLALLGKNNPATAGGVGV